MGFQCVVQMKVLVRGDGTRQDGKGKAAHKANAGVIVHEAFEIEDPKDGHAIPIRKSASETYYRSRTVNNKYVGPRTADGVMRRLEEEADKQKIEVHNVDKKTGETIVRYKSIQSNTPIGIAVIFHPPCAVARNWTPEQSAKFIQDCEEVMAQIPCMKLDKEGHIKRNEDGTPIEEPRYLFRTENRIARAEHWDESEPGDPPVFSQHWHEVYVPRDQYGKYNGSMIDGKFLSVMVNHMFPQLMRERGWDIDDPEHTNWEEFHKNKEYRRKRKAKIKQGGKPVNNYIADKRLAEANAQLEETAAMMEQAKTIMADVAQKEQEADEKVRTAETEKQEAEAAKNKAQAEKEDAERQRDDALEAKQQAESARDDAVAQKDQAESDANAAFQEQQRLQMGNKLLGEMQASAQAELGSAQKARDAARTEAENLRKNKVAQAEQAAAEAAEKERARIEAEIRKKITKDAEADRDAARTEADELRRTMVAQAEQAAEARRKELDSAIDKARATLAALQEKAENLQEWIDGKIQKAERRADRIIDVAKRTAESIRAAAEGEHAFFIDYFGKEPFVYKKGPNQGKSFLDVARKKYEQKLRNERLRNMPTDVRDAGRSHSDELGGPTGLGT